jgi:hypothetical protein
MYSGRIYALFASFSQVLDGGNYRFSWFEEMSYVKISKIFSSCEKTSRRDRVDIGLQ